MASFMRTGSIDDDFMDYLPFHDRFNAPANYRLTTEQFQAALSSAYGDGYLHKPNKDSKYPRICWNLGPNKMHAKYKRDFFAFLGATIETKVNPGFGSEWNCVKTSCHPCLVPVYEIVFVDGKKTVSKEAFSMFGDVGWAWFYGDDGHLAKKCNEIYLHTEGYGEHGSEIIKDCLNEYMGFSCSTVFKYLGGTPKKDRFCVKINGVGSDEFIKRVGKHMANGMEYKTIKSNNKRRIKR